jgi:hypothetical protein
MIKPVRFVHFLGFFSLFFFLAKTEPAAHSLALVDDRVPHQICLGSPKDSFN